MRNKKFAMIFCCLIVVLLSSMSGFGQTDPLGQKTISGGVLNGKAVSLPKPRYPAAARAVGASGAVTVQILVDANGNVVSANAVSGHPMLKAAAEEAARNAKFSPTLLAGQPVKVSGVITYNFVGPTSVVNVGFKFGYIERSKRFPSGTSLSSLAAELPPEMAEIKARLRTLEDSAKKDLFAVNTPPPDVKPKIEKEPAKAPPDYTGPVNTNNRFTVKGSVANSVQGSPLSDESAKELRAIIDEIETALSPNERTAWYFRLGRLVGAAHSSVKDDERLNADLVNLGTHAANAPSVVPENTLARIRAVAELQNQNPRTDDERKEIEEKLRELSRLRAQ